MSASIKREEISTHFVVRVVVEQVTKTGVIPYNGTHIEATDIKRDVSEVGNAVTTGDTLTGALSKAARYLEIVGE